MSIEGTWSIDVGATVAKAGVIDLRVGAVIQSGQPTGSYSESAGGRVAIRFAYDGGKDGNRIEGNTKHVREAEQAAPQGVRDDNVSVRQDDGGPDNFAPV
jgi:hypothetical protein